MKDILQYKLPNENTVKLNGSFKSCSDFNEIDGFFLSDFKKDKLYCFVEGDTEDVYSSQENLPVAISMQEYLAQGELFLSSFEKCGVDKAIFSRVKLEEQSVDSNELFESLCGLYPKAFVYLIRSKMFGTWIGATPEVLLRREDTYSETMSLAGTKPMDDDSPWSFKERQEQNYVTEFIDQILKESNVSSLMKSEVNTVLAGPVKHLITEFQFQLNYEDTLTIASKLHPTPAVSGLPRAAALKLIDSHELHDRELYAGMIGIHSKEVSDIFVNLRCAQVFENHIALYLGGGYTMDSIVEKEWQETESKALTLLDPISQLKNR
ncbi:MAG: chorismate-binding protein [Crocinitomicaceae bacterium]|nr:chorismate-binding protein [Crocinitomicaceae bacterium]